MNTLVWKNSHYVILNIKQHEKNTYLQQKLQNTILYNNVTFKLHKFFKILQINKLYIVSTGFAGIYVRHGASFFCLLVCLFLNHTVNKFFPPGELQVFSQCLE